jgi:hypothetical protein
MDRFLADNQLIKDVTVMVEERIKKEGNEEAAKTIYKYVEQPRSSGAHGAIELELQLAARAFMTEMDYPPEKVAAILAKEEAEQQLKGGAPKGPAG